MEASAKGKSLSIVLCTAAVICSQLLEIDPYGGMRRYWFDDLPLLTTAQIQQCLDDAIASLAKIYFNAGCGDECSCRLDFFGGLVTLRVVRNIINTNHWEFHSLNGYGRKSLDILSETCATSATALIEEIIATVRAWEITMSQLHRLQIFPLLCHPYWHLSLMPAMLRR